jgi:hypothetical protein
LLEGRAFGLQPALKRAIADAQCRGDVLPARLRTQHMAAQHPLHLMTRPCSLKAFELVFEQPFVQHRHRLIEQGGASHHGVADKAQIAVGGGLVSPEEMEAYLKANPGPLKGK